MQGSPIVEKSASYSVIPGSGIQATLPQQFSAFGLSYASADLSAYTHLSVTISNNSPAPTIVEMVVDSGTSGWAWSDFVIGANKSETVTVPLQLSVIGGWGNGYPTGDGSIYQPAFYGSIVKNAIRMIRFWNPMRTASQDLTIGQLTPIFLATPTTAIIDQYGQQNIAFPGEITSDAQLANQIAIDNQLSGQFPYSSDAYAGVAGSGLDAGTGKWRVAKQNNKWYIITPNGDRFFSTGVDCVGNGSLAYTAGRSSLFGSGALPPTQGSVLSQFYYSAVNPATGQPESGYDFYQSNLERKYGPNWSAQGDATALRRLKTWGFNTVGPASHWSLYSNASLQMPNMQEIAITGGFRSVPCPNASSPMPDPYDPAWATAVSNVLTPLVGKLNADPYNVGLFIDNELPWAQPWSQPNCRYDLAFNVLSAPSDQPAKQRFYHNLTLKYRTISKLNSVWGTHYLSWTDFLNNRAYRPASPTGACMSDMQTFLSQFAVQYFSTVKSKLATLNYSGLYLGCRFSYYSPETVAAAAQYCQVVSFNAYDLTPSQWRSDLKAINAPVLISEFGFAAADQGRVGGFSPCGVTEDDRVQGYQSYIADASTWPNLVGMHWYKWEDDPISGRMWDNSNETLGLVSITDVPYSAMVSAATQANTDFNNRLLIP